ncbi:phosphate transport system permease protein [Flavobacterium sp. 7E]|uniref:phosphate ABC transporter permease subunit PstC n=1 Tax=unclassified Flavobacterium TaxID=196869 RepID=UPI001A04E334|nr:MULTISPECIES: phosphate ABC transporter permease subunit PstC [unclassified Flavobacterium]MBE0391805.1 Phosphate transport system permease protein PstC [Flavobacterium sp. PL002]NRS87153.1 phosphate transport system permease protein [Flavobacterium sp. 7E]NRT14119.1 phosphate transport system permease protein [Flavobacterium sp. 28A]
MKTNFKKIKEKIIETILMLSSAATSITVVLIVFFLFIEGAGVFSKKPIDDGFLLAVSVDNPVRKLKPSEIKDIYDQKITNWKELGGKDVPIVLFRAGDITDYYTEEELGKNFEFFPDKINELVAKTPGIIAFFSDKYKAKDFKGRELDIDKIKVSEFLSGEEWFPTAQPIAQMGVKPLIYGTLWVSFGAILLALPIGLAAAIYLSEIAKKRTRSILKPIIELLAGIPSVVYGFFGLVIIVPLIQSTFNLPVGETGLAGSVVLAIMALPTIITISEDAMRNTPRAMKEASLALGASQWQTIYKVVMPYSASGITAGAILGIGRAIGETMAVLMVTGNAAVIPTTLLEPVRTIPATIAAELGEAPNGGLHYEALFALGCILFIITFVINMLVEVVTNRKSHKKH